MTSSSDAAFARVLRLPSAPLSPRPVLATDLRARLHRRLGLEPPADATPMPRAAGLEYEVGGNPDGEAVLFMHAGTATAFVPLMQEPALADRYRLVRYHRRGYAGSDGLDGAASIDLHVRDALALLDHLGIERAHVVGHSGSGIIALELALDAPHVVQSLVLEEPAIHPIDPQWAAAIREAIAPPVARFRSRDVRGAIEMWMGAISPSWRADLTRTVPGGPQQTLEDAAAFFAEVDAVDTWEFDRVRDEGITSPVLYVVAARSRHDILLRHFHEVVPQTESAVIADATHMLHTDQPALVAAEMSAFFARHTERA
jgi:pimeloyl-ACP methyl ester carboxylesterase